MERTLLAFLFYFQSFRNGRLFSYPKSKGERRNMNKLVKRLLTGTLAFATILTALPVTAVHASGNQYWTESAERVGYIEHVMNDGSIKSTFNASGELVKHEEQDKAGMGYTLYIGSLKSEVYFCVYEKSYEQYIKLGIPIEEAPIKNRFEIRLKNERAYYAVRDLLTYYDAERTAFSIINRYVRFVDKEADKKRSDWKLSVRWAWFIGENREPLKLTTKPEPYTLDRTLRWIQRQVDPTLKMLETITAKTGIDYLKEIRKSTKLTEKHYKIIEQQTTSTEDVILEKEN